MVCFAATRIIREKEKELGISRVPIICLTGNEGYMCSVIVAFVEYSLAY